ncbi:MAG: hypothetical protein ACJAVK_001465 [Akkermansiaceae bacterium]|jgi:hypothetical protein
MKFFVLALASIALASCASTKTAERRPVPPPGTGEDGSIPWNDPSQGVAPGGALGGMMEGR